jgi:TetR/AcrR family transcriptional regulator, cholesterol catabolism regulator
MVTTRNSRDDVVRAAGRLFADRGYHGTSMRDLGKELGLLGSSLYSHVSSKQDLLVEVVEEGARLFEESAAKALDSGGTAAARLEALIAGHLDVVVDNIDVARTFLNEARVLDADHRSKIIDARDHYEEGFRSVIREGIDDGSFAEDVDVDISSIFILSILNAIERWYRPEGRLGRDALVAELSRFARSALS